MSSKQIKSIEVERLFGLYDYTLNIPVEAKDNVFILYGDNGTGKSTILRLVYHLLSSEVGYAHKSYLANVAFKSLTVSFNDETIVKVLRQDDNDDLLGDYILLLQNAEKQLECEMPSEWDEESHRFRINLFSPSNPTNRKNYHQILKNLNSFSVFYISDQRNDELRDNYVDPRLRRSRPLEDPVEKEMTLLHEWIIGQALEASKKGEEGTSEIYVKILAKLCDRKNKEEKQLTYEDTQKEMERLLQRAQSYAQIGFISETGYSDIVAKLAKVQKKNRQPAADILKPYIEIQKNRIDALDNLFETIIFLNKSLNDYLYKKRVIYSVDKGFKFYQYKEYRFNEQNPLYDEKDEIEVKRLSSGERQLLRLFSMVIRNSNFCPIIIIDEPEISLNIKWQRRLLSTLNFFVRDTNAQFVVATHSFEILSSHLKNTVKVGDSYIPINNV